VAACAATALQGCALVPDVPPDPALPIKEILAQTACELQQTFISLSRSPNLQRFQAEQWLVNVSITPKVDTDLNGSAGWTRKHPFLGNPSRFTTWAISGPGLQLDAKAERNSGITFTFKSADLMRDKVLQCPPPIPSLHVLAQHLGVEAWLRRTAEAMTIASSANIDKPTYNTEITIKFAANGSYTFTFPPGTDLATFGGSYILDEQLNISMAPISKKISVVTLPVGQTFGADAITSTQEQAAQSRLDLIQLEQAIRSIQSRPN
jgi:hypothetical protein